jgi:plastocyanin domain-containing protein
MATVVRTEAAAGKTLCASPNYTGSLMMESVLDEIVVTAIGVCLISFIHWFFFMKNDDVVTADKSIEVTVDGGYTPQTIKAEIGKELTITFLRKDPSPCLEEIIMSEFGIRTSLPLNQKLQLKITPIEAKDYTFT